MAEPAAYGAFPLKQFLAMDVDSDDPGHATATIEISEQHLNPNQVAHGAVLFAMVDTSMGKATMSVLDEGQLCATIDVQVRFIRPARNGETVRAETSVVHRGRKLIQLESRVVNTDGRLLATGTGAFSVIAP